MAEQLMVETGRGAGRAQPVVVLGLGPMGAALTRALLAEGVPTTVWNRTASAADAMAREGAVAARTVADAVVAADLVIVCLRDHDVVRQTLGAVDPAALAGRTVVNLSSATPAQARQTAEWFEARGIAYLNGAIMVPTPHVGTPEALILYSGDREVFERHVDRLRPLAGIPDHVAQDPGGAALHDVAMLEIYFAAMTAFLHAAAMVTSQGLQARAFLPYAEAIAALLPETFAGLGEEVDASSYPGDEDRVAMELAALEHIVAASDELGLDGLLPRAMRDLAARTVESGRGGESFTSVIEAIRTHRRG